ncbi:MAG: type II toxin-antitoxin system YafQ family toxin [Patescibacteria group bacterium]
MKVEFDEGFHKIFRKRFGHIPSIKKKFKERTILFAQNPRYPLLQNHALAGAKKMLRSFSITGDILVLYYVKGDTAHFIDIGTHNQVYR